MHNFSVSSVIAISLSTAIGFTCGYLFHASYGEARSAAGEAVWSAQATQRVLQGYEPILITSKFHNELMVARTLEDLSVLRQKYLEATLSNISSFERRASALELPKERVLAEPFLRDAEKTRRELDAK
ncbi:hypothetical protein [Pseudoduganella violaceinigra]|uniref:hypothetical protein n=1 Tax=Pseudoduganella violaceinigra TaxID=246602 RepID=UPI00048116B9|nr:hypothetical protein [Pseudoduganella violaceinigra]